MKIINPTRYPATNLECGGKRSATPLWIRESNKFKESKAAPLSPHSKSGSLQRGPFLLRLVLLLLIVISCNILVSLAQTEPGRSTTTPPVPKASPAPTITGTIKGRLIADDGQPLTNATVMAQSLTQTPGAKPAHVDSEGRFVFEELSPAAYLVFATAPGYIDQSLSLGSPSQWPRHLIGSNLTITMIKGGVITGTVTNAKGEPLTGVPVRAMASGGNPSSLTSLFSGGGAGETDDRGVYRIYGLLPGQYTVQAGGKGSFGQFTPSGFDIDVPTYYPSATRDTATPVSVRSGDETTGVDIKYRGSEGHSISGFVLGDLQVSALSGAVTVFLTHVGSSTPLSLEIVAATEPRRAFSFNGVGDGEYDVFAGYFTGPAENGWVATKRAVVRGGDTTGIELRLAPLASITGTIALDPIQTEDKCDQRNSQLIETILNLPRDEPKKGAVETIVSMIGGGLGSLNEKGEFALRNLEAARYRLEVKLPSESWYVRAINLPGAAAPKATQPQPAIANPNANTWPGVVTLKSGEQLSGAAIMLGQDAAGLRGKVTVSGEAATTQGIPVGARVHLVPAEREQTDNLLRYNETLVNRDGTFAFTNLAPGRYFILARVGPAPEPDTPSQPVARDPAARAKVRREAEAVNAIVELKPCQRVVDHVVKLGG